MMNNEHYDGQEHKDNLYHLEPQPVQPIRPARKKPSATTKLVALLGELGGSPAHLMWHSSGRLVSVYGYREAPYGIRAMISDDGGKTWTTDYVIDDQGQSGDLGYPATVELKDGSLLTLYYENRDGVSRIMYNVWKLPL